MKYIWSGALNFGLIFMPVKIYPAARGRKLNFNYLSKKDYCPISYLKVCKTTGEEVKKEEIIKGYQYQKGKYVIMDEKDFAKAFPKKTKSISIVDFVDQAEVDFKYIEKPYYLEPAAEAKKVYGLLREALKKTKKAGIARYVIKNKEHIGLIKPENDLIMLHQMRFEEELVEQRDLDIPKEKYSESREMELAITLIKQLSSSFEPKKYKDTYSSELQKIIETKAKGKEIISREKEPSFTAAPDLMAMLKQSLEKSKNK